MTESIVFKSDDARQRMKAWHARFMAELDDFDVREEDIDTPFGTTRILRGGDPEAPPLVSLHGALSGAPHAMGQMPGLFDHFDVYAPNILGHSAQGDEVRLPLKGDAYAQWISAIMDHYGLDSALFCAASWGAFVTLRTATHAPERVRRMALMVPAGLVSGPAWAGLTKVGWPLMRYKLRPTPERLERALANLFTDLEDPMWMPFMGDVFNDFKTDLSIPPLLSKGDLDGYRGKALIIAGSHDLSFPGERIQKRAPEVLPDVEVHVVRGMRHTPPFQEAGRAEIERRIIEFLER
ncbi:MAG: alpha/beta hydrolase [Myxococcota bacterium]